MIAPSSINAHQSMRALEKLSRPLPAAALVMQGARETDNARKVT
jgi:hypothetical protein